MIEIKKNNILLNCNTIPVKDILEIIKSGDITIEEFKTAGLSQEIISELEAMEKSRAENSTRSCRSVAPAG